MTVSQWRTGIVAAVALTVLNCAQGMEKPSISSQPGGDTRSVRTDGSKSRTAPAVKQPPVDFNHPPRKYISHLLQGWEVLIEKQLADESPELAEKAQTRLETELGKIQKLLPAHALPRLKRVRLFIMHGPRSHAGGREGGLEYFSADAPSHHAWLDARMSSSIVIYNAKKFESLSDQWALKALIHEFGHAQHLERWIEDRSDIYDTWKAALDAGLFKTVRDEDKGSHFPNYAAQNHLEYFAELTAAYFSGNTYYPRNRTELKAYDPAGYALIEKLWGVNQPAPPPSRKEAVE